MPRARTRLFTARQAADLLGQGDTFASTRDQTPPTINASPTSNTFVSSRDNTPPTVNPSPTAAAGTHATSIPRGGSTGESQAANMSTAETAASSQPCTRKKRGPYGGGNLYKKTNNGTKKINIFFELSRPDLMRPVCKGSTKLVSWLGRCVRDVAQTPLRKWKSFTDAEIQTMMAKVKMFFNFTGPRADDYLNFCMDTLNRSLNGWRYETKKEYLAWLNRDEATRKPPKDFSEQQWAELVAYFGSDEQQEKSIINGTNRSKSKVVHTTGTISFAEFEYRHTTCAEDGTLIWPEPSEAWMLEHTHKNSEGEQVYVDHVSAQIHEKIVSLEAQQSASGSSPNDTYPTDVVLSQHHNRRVGRGSGFAPLTVKRHKRSNDEEVQEVMRTQLQQEVDVVRQQFEEKMTRMDQQIQVEVEARRKAEEQLEQERQERQETAREVQELRRKHEEFQLQMKRQFDDMMSQMRGFS